MCDHRGIFILTLRACSEVEGVVERTVGCFLPRIFCLLSTLPYFILSNLFVLAGEKGLNASVISNAASLSLIQRGQQQTPALCLGLTSEGDTILVLHRKAYALALAAHRVGLSLSLTPLPLERCYHPSASLSPSVKWGCVHDCSVTVEIRWNVVTGVLHTLSRLQCRERQTDRQTDRQSCPCV